MKNIFWLYCSICHKWALITKMSIQLSMIIEAQTMKIANDHRKVKWYWTCGHVDNTSTKVTKYGISFAWVLCQIHFTCFPSSLCQISKSTLLIFLFGYFVKLILILCQVHIPKSPIPNYQNKQCQISKYTSTCECLQWASSCLQI